MKIFEKSKLTIAGFVALPIFVTLLCYVINWFAPNSPKSPNVVLIFHDFLNFLSDENAMSVLKNTLSSIFISISVSVLVGIVLGIALGSNDKVWKLSQPSVDFFRSIPVTFLIPITVSLISRESPNVVWLMATYQCILTMILTIRAGYVKQEAERVFYYSIISGSKNGFKKFFNVTLFEILPDVATGFKVALSQSIVIVTILEFMNFGNKIGIGKLVNVELHRDNFIRVYTLTIVIGLLGFLLNKIVELLEHRLIHWVRDKK